MIVELGCGTDPVERADVHHDRTKHSDYVDVAHDLQVLPWPWDDGSLDELLAIDVFEHLRPDRVQIPTRPGLRPGMDWWFWLDEAYRVLKPGGLLTMRLPAWDNPLSYRDPTHQRVFHPQTFLYWDPCTAVWRDFGRIYALSGERYWHQQAEIRDSNDIRYFLRKLPTELCPESPVLDPE